MKKFLATFFLILFFFSPHWVQAQTEKYLEAEVIEIKGEKEILYPGESQTQLTQDLVLQLKADGQKVEIEQQQGRSLNDQRYQVGDQLVLYQALASENYLIADFVRRPSLILLAIIFILTAVVIGRWQGLAAIFGLGLSFLIIFFFIVPQIGAGGNPIFIVSLGSLIIVPVFFLLSHGFNRKTWVAIFSTLISLVFTSLLIFFFTQKTKLTGFASEEAGFIQAMIPGAINLKNLLIAGMIIATLGVLDDVTISQAAVVEELKKANAQLNFLQLYQQAMNIGRDHIASMINTLILVYAGASFPLLLLFTMSGQEMSMILNFEIVAEEIVRMLTGSLGLMFAIPLTTALAALVVTNQEENHLKNKS